MDKKTQDNAMMMQGLYWWGVPTLFRCPHNPDPEGCDIALVGVPHSTGNGTTQRDQHLGPRAVRNISALGRRGHLKFGISPWGMCDIRDLGDVPLPEANNNERCIERITEFMRGLLKVAQDQFQLVVTTLLRVEFFKASPVQSQSLQVVKKLCLFILMLILMHIISLIIF